MPSVIRSDRPAAPSAAGASGRVDFRKDGPLSMPFTVTVNGRATPAKLTGELKTSSGNMDGKPAKYIMEPRVELGGKKYLLSDAALSALLDKAGGYTPEHGFSGQTRVFSEGWIGLGKKDAINFENGAFVLGKGKGYYHDNFVCVNGPGLPRVDY